MANNRARHGANILTMNNIKQRWTRRRINAVNKVAYNVAASEYENREEREFSMKNDPIFVAAFLKRVKEKFPHLRNDQMAILDVGVGPGVNLDMFAQEEFRTYGVDISRGMLKVAKKRAPEARYTRRDYLKYEPKRKFHGIMMKAFIHLFTESIARRILKKAWRDLEEGGVVFLATTVHDASTEGGLEQKADFPMEAKRYRKRWTKESFVSFLESVPGFEIIDEDPGVTFQTDASGKQWMNFMLRKIAK